MIKLYHYSNKDFKGYIKPSFFGQNDYTQNSAQLSDVNRSFFYLSSKGREIYFQGAKFCYIAEIEKHRLYDLNKDKLKLYELFDSADKLIKKIKFYGFEGFYSNNGDNVVCLFKPIKYIDKKVIR